MTKLFGIPMGIAGRRAGGGSSPRSRRWPSLAARNRVFFRLGVRNARAPAAAAAALIVVGLMLGTAIIAAALATGDTMTQTIRSSAVVVARPDRRARVGARRDADGRGAERCCDRRAVLPAGRLRRRPARGGRLAARRRRRPGDHRDRRRAGSGPAARRSPR